MDAGKVRLFMQLAGQEVASKLKDGTPEQRKLGAQLLLSETLEYIIKGLKVTPHIHGNPVSDPEAISYDAKDEAPDRVEMLDGLSDVAYTMYWNACCFGVPLEDAYNLVCDNNLEKFVHLDKKAFAPGIISKEKWDCGRGVVWPSEVEKVEVVRVEGELYAVGKDGRGKVRKPSTYKPVDLEPLTAMS